jgi:hypothetical protein
VLRRRIANALAVVASAFVLTSAAMFWFLILAPSKGGWITDSITTYYDYGGGGYSPDTDALKKLSPSEERERLEYIAEELKQKPNVELFQMKAYDDVCENGLIDCRSLSSAKVKPFIEAILSDRQAAETALHARTADVIAGGSLIVSFLALIFTALTYRRKRTN